MPNGGSDCCGTCWFNARNGGNAGYSHADESIAPACTIRDGLPIVNPFWTYCANHPHHNPGRVSVPVGPVYTADDDHGRVIWRDSADTERIRTELIHIVAAGDDPGPGYPAGLPLRAAAVVQLGQFREVRGLAALEQARVSGRLAEIAGRSLAQVLPPGSLAAHATPDVTALARAAGDGDSGGLPVLADALEEAGYRGAAVLAHLREPGHVPGPCWVAEVLLAAPPPG